MFSDAWKQLRCYHDDHPKRRIYITSAMSPSSYIFQCPRCGAYMIANPSLWKSIPQAISFKTYQYLLNNHIEKEL